MIQVYILIFFLFSSNFFSPSSCFLAFFPLHASFTLFCLSTSQEHHSSASSNLATHTSRVSICSSCLSGFPRVSLVAIMFSLLQLVWVLYLAIIARAQVQLTAAESPTAISSCTLFYTPSMPPQIGPTSTVYATMMTTQLNVVNCDYCHISNVPENPMPAVSPRVTLCFEMIC